MREACGMLIGPLYLKLDTSDRKIQVVQGGGDAGKTVTILQKMAWRRTSLRGTLGTVTAMDMPNLRGGALRTFQKYVEPDFHTDIRSFNISNSTYYWKNGSVLEFKAFEDSQDAAGSERDDLFVNEAPGITYDLFWQLQRKTRLWVAVDYNPIHRFWVHERLVDPATAEKEFLGKVQFWRLWHIHNPFLTPEQHQAYEDIGDPDMFKVYSRGLTGKIKGLIFGHFKKWNEPFPLEADGWRIIWGQDIGYTSDPTAIVKMALKGRQRVGKEICYEPGLSDESVRNLLQLHGYESGQYLYSEPDPNFINQLRILGVAAVPAIKGPGSVAAGISKVRQHDCWYIGENFEKEIGTYKFLEAEDILTGKTVTTNVPVKGHDHLCDAFRYGDYTDGFRQL